MPALDSIVESTIINSPIMADFHKLKGALDGYYANMAKKPVLFNKYHSTPYVADAVSLNTALLMYADENGSSIGPYALSLPKKEQLGLEKHLSAAYGHKVTIGPPQNGVYNVRDPVSGKHYLSFKIIAYNQEAARYQWLFSHQLDYLTAKLRDPNKAKAYLHDQMEILKDMFTKAGLYSGEYGSPLVYGMGAEQLLLQSGKIRPKSEKQLESLYSANTVMEKLLADKGDLKIIDPQDGKDLAKSLRYNNEGWNKLLQIAEQYMKHCNNHELIPYKKRRDEHETDGSKDSGASKSPQEDRRPYKMLKYLNSSAGSRLYPQRLLDSTNGRPLKTYELASAMYNVTKPGTENTRSLVYKS